MSSTLSITLLKQGVNETGTSVWKNLECALKRAIIVALAGAAIALQSATCAQPNAIPALTEALDDTNLVWSTSGVWAGWRLQSAISHDGVDAAEDGPLQAGIIAEQAALATTIAGPGMLSFWWKLEDPACFAFDFSVGTNETAYLGAVFHEVPDWQQQEIRIPIGAQTLRWVFGTVCGDGSLPGRARLDEVKYTPDPDQPPLIITQPSDVTVRSGQSVSLEVRAGGEAPLSYQWHVGQSGDIRHPIASATNAIYSLTNITRSSSYWVRVTNGVGAAQSRTATVSIEGLPSIMALISANAAPPFTGQSNQVVVSFSRRLQAGPNSPATDPANYAVTVLGASSIIPVTNVSTLNTQVSLTVNQDLIYGTNYVLTVNNVTGTNLLPILPNSQIGITMLRSNPPPSFTNLMQMSQSWDWNENAGNDASGNPLATSWLAPGYIEDSSWSSGNGIFYFSNLGFAPSCSGSPGTGVSQGLPTYYFLTKFVFPPGLPSSGTLRFTHFVDDGAVFYLNECEVLRFNMPTGPIIWNVVATHMIVVPSCVTADVIVDHLLLPGTNTLAVEVHEAGGANDVDVYFGMSLDYATNLVAFSTNTSPLPPIVFITPTSPNTQALSWVNTAEWIWGLESATNLGPNAVWTPLAGSSPYTNTSTESRFFRAHVQ